VSNASASVMRMICARLSVRAAGLSKKCCDMGSNPLSGRALCVAAVEIERQLDYIPGDDCDDGVQSRCCNLGAGRRANGDRFRLKKRPTSGPLSSVSRRGAALFSSSPRIRVGHRPGLSRCRHLAILHER
jgi:hypothetical protein